VTSGVDMGYRSQELMGGGAQAAAAGGVADGAAGLLRPVVCASASLGLVAGAEALAAAVVRLRDTTVQLAERVAAGHADLQARAGQVAAEGDGLAERTAAVAATGVPGGA
jgi:hypothetical protein